MKAINQFWHRIGLTALFFMAFAFLPQGCSLMDYSVPDCGYTLKVRFVYDYNMKYADAFPHEVKTLTLYAFDQNGSLALTRTAATDTIISKGYMEISGLESGNYRLLVWAEGEQRHKDTYSFGRIELGSKDRLALTAKVNREGTTVGNDLTALYYGELENADFTDVPEGGERTVTVPLKKNTNLFKVVLQNLSGEPLNPDDFDYFITDSNGWLDGDNNLLQDDTLTYPAWSKYSGEAGISTDDSGVQTGVTAAIAELTTNRLMKGHDMRLRIVRNDTGKTIVNIPLVDYCLLVKGKYNEQMSDQEYLDRQDSYDLVFFIDKTRNWMSSVIYVNSWRVVLQNVDL